MGLRRFQRIRLVTLPLMFRMCLPSFEQHVHLPVQGHLDRIGDRGTGADVRGAQGQPGHVPDHRGWVSRARSISPCWLIALGLRRLRRRSGWLPVAMSPIVRWLPALTASLLTTVLLAALALLIATLAGIVAGLLLLHGPRPLRALIRLYVDLARRSDLVLLYAWAASRASSVPDSIPGRRRGCTQRVRGRTRDRDRPRWDRVPVPPPPRRPSRPVSPPPSGSAW